MCQTAVVEEDLGYIHCAGIHPFDRMTEEDRYYNHCYSWADLRNLLDRRSRRGHDRPFHRGMVWDHRIRSHHGRVLSHVVGSFRDHGIPFRARNKKNTYYLSIELKNLAILWDGKDY